MEPIFCSIAVIALSTARNRPATSPPFRLKPVSMDAADTPRAPTDSAIVDMAHVDGADGRLVFDMLLMYEYRL